MNESNAWEELNQEFVQDHRVLSRGYLDARKALEANNPEAARVVAERLDQEAGAHIEFEEQHLYPVVAQARGEAYASRLYDEHQTALKALTEIRESTSMDEVQKARWIAGLNEGLDHAATCGTLLSHLQSLPAAKQAALLEELRQLRARHRRWSALEKNSRTTSGPAA